MVRSPLALVAIVTVPLLAAGPAPDGRGPAPRPVPPKADVHISDGHPTVHEGTEIEYDIDVVDTGTVDLRDAYVEVGFPAGLSVLDGTIGEVVAPGSIGWPVSVSAGGQARFVFHAKVGALPSSLHRLDVTACVREGADQLGCATVSDRVMRLGFWANVVAVLALLAVVLLLFFTGRHLVRRRTRVEPFEPAYERESESAGVH